MHQHTNHDKKGFTLLEITVSLVVFSIVIVGMGSVFISLYNQQRSQGRTLNVVRSAGWAVDFMSNAVRFSSAASSPGWAQIATEDNGRTLRFGLDTDGDNSADTRVWYWLGDGGNFGNANTIYQGTGMGRGTANNNRQELMNFVIDNPSGNPLFLISPNMQNMLIIELTVRPNPGLPPSSQSNPNYTLTSRVRVRNGVPPPWCGDRVCNGGETCSSCPGDCGACSPYHIVGPTNGAFQGDNYCNTVWPGSHMGDPSEIDACIGSGVCNTTDRYWISSFDSCAICVNISGEESVTSCDPPFGSGSGTLWGTFYQNHNTSIQTCDRLARVVCVE